MALVADQERLWDEQYRGAIAGELIEECASRPVSISETEGFTLLPQGTMPAYEAFRNRALLLFEERRQDDDTIREDLVKGSVKKAKDYMQSVLWAEDFARYPELLALGLDRRVLAAASAYLGTLPVLRTVQVFWTPAPKDDQLQGSQFYHFDHDEYREVKMFFYLHEVDDARGPFTFLPGSVSRAVAERAAPIKGKRYADEEVYRFCDPGDAIQIKGPAGTGGIVDTANCLHFGGRVRDEGRLMVQLQYLRPNSNVIAYGRINMGEIQGLDLDALGRMIVSVPPWAELAPTS